MTYETQFTQLLQSSPVAMSLCRLDDQTVVEVNDAFLETFGLTHDKVVGHTPPDVVGIARLREQPSIHEPELAIATPHGLKRIMLWSRTIELDGTTHALSTFVDITDRLALEAQVREAQKLESLGLLAGGVAHDFNNILAVIASSASLLADVLSSADDRELVTEIDEAVRRATGLTRQLLAFSRKQVVEPVVLDLNATVSETRKMLRRMVGEDIVIETSLDPELGHVRIDPGYLVQVLMNLAVNSRDAMPRGGTLAITTRNAPGEPRRVRITVADTGTGMSPELCARVFEPFFTTKGLGKGTGLGLSVVHGIIQQAGGEIAIESEVGVGTSIQIFLPRVDAPADEIADVAAACSRGSEKIIVVDDDLFVRRATSRALRSRGYDVLEASDGMGALRLLRDHGRDVSLLVTDVVMPGMDGCELAAVARQRRPSLKVLYMSGYTDDALTHHQIDGSVVEKPFPGHVLAGKVRQTIDSR